MEKRYVEYNGVRVVEGWSEKIQEAQSQASWVIDGIEHPRVAYGSEDEDWGADQRPCDDCAVVKGQLHVPGCDAERCPVCGGQAIGCDCNYAGDEAEDDE
jgi:hypothetical protein